MIERLLGNDLVINEDSCNLSCSYCLTGQSNFKKKHAEKRTFRTPYRDQYSEGSALKARLDGILERYDARFDPMLLKITGGEVFLVEGIETFIEACLSRYERVIVQTNGTLITPAQLERLSGCDGLIYQLSLDCHLYEGNVYRVCDERQHRNVLACAEALLSSGPSVEVYCVLNDRSSNHVLAFARWLQRHAPHAKLYPFPVRGPARGRYQVGENQVRYVEALLEAFDELQESLPPRAYVEKLVQFSRGRRKEGACHVPRFIASTFSDGAVTACPNIWFSELGNILGDDWPQFSMRMGESGLYKALLGPRRRLDACVGCMTPWDILTLFVEGHITWDELCKDRVYGARRIRAYLAQARNSVSGTVTNGTRDGTLEL